MNPQIARIAQNDVADCGCGESIDGLATSWKYWGAERLRYRQARLEMLLHLSVIP
ncbi:MAG: hypothetical protein GX946_07905 [Oligosphaeraceae bacterium]|nr:hypothetical protein [Oligosphaeraceae bacterium]